MEKIDVVVSKVTDWDFVLDTARLTINKERLKKEPSDSWKAKILLAEHSPIRTLQYLVEIRNIPSWVSQHIARHDAFAYHTVRECINDIHFVGTARSDRTGINRNDLSQSAPVNHTIFLNAQDVMNISRKRLCSCASKETKDVWAMVVNKINEINPILADKCVKECIYRGFCPEIKGCGYDKTEKFKTDLEKYRKVDY
jgi:hypothetical protein